MKRREACRSGLLVIISSSLGSSLEATQHQRPRLTDLISFCTAFLCCCSLVSSICLCMALDDVAVGPPMSGANGASSLFFSRVAESSSRF